jgi:predicted transcriptional regulator
MEVREVFISYLNQDPARYAVASSETAVSVLARIAEQARSADDLARACGINQQEAKAAAKKCVDAGLAEAMRLREAAEIFYVTEEGKRFLELYKSVKETVGMQ